MTIKFARRVAAEMLKRGESSIRINTNSFDDVQKAMTRDDVRKLVSSGALFAVKAKHNASINAKLLKERRAQGRRRGRGRRKGTYKARSGELWMRKVRSQRLFLEKLKEKDKLDNMTFKKYYKMIKGNSFADKASLILHLGEEGIKISGEEVARINEEIARSYKEGKR